MTNRDRKRRPGGAVVLLALVSAGCSAPYALPAFPPGHPASPEAPEAPPPAPSQALTGMLLPAPAGEASGHAGHEGMHHGAKGGSR